MQNTLTVPNDFVTECQQRIAGVTFYFSRGFDGEGLWFHSERIANTPAHSAAPLMLQQDLSVMAREKGLSELHNFSRMVPKKVPATREARQPRQSRKIESPLFGGFNPFAVQG